VKTTGEDKNLTVQTIVECREAPLACDELLKACRPLIAGVIRERYEKLVGAGS
jgi:hypothetical protein